MRRESTRIRRLLPPPSPGYRVAADGGLYIRRGSTEMRLRLEVYDPTVDVAQSAPLFVVSRGRA